MSNVDIACETSDFISWHTPLATATVRQNTPTRIRLDHGYEPDWHFAGFHEIGDPEINEFVAAGIEHVLFDLDGCLSPAYQHDEIDEEAIRVIDQMNEQFATVSLATNNRVKLGWLARDLGMTCLFQPHDQKIFLGYKPNRYFFKRIFRDLGYPAASSMLMVGDNPRHDVAGAQAVGMKAVLVDCLDPDGFFEYDLYEPKI